MVELKEDTDYAEEVAERDEVSILASKPIIRIVTIDSFELWCWKRLLRVPWIARRSNQLILKEINAEYSLEGLMLKLKLQYFGYLMQRANSLEKIPDAGKD